MELQICFLEAGEMISLLENEGVKVFCLEAGRLREPSRLFRTVVALRNLVRREKPDAVLGWMTKAHIYSGLAALGTPSKAFYFQMGLPDYGIVERLSRMVPAAGALGCSKFVAAEQQKFVSHPVLGVSLSSELCGRELAPISRAEVRAKLGLDRDCVLVGIVGRLQRWKGMHIFIEAMALVVERHPKARGLIVGGVHDLEPEYPPMLEKLRKKKGLVGLVTMVGKQRNVSDWIAAMDICVHASYREPFGIVVLESMASGKATVATRPGGPEEIITNGVDGLLVPSGDAEQLAIAIQSLIEDPSLAASVAAAAKKRAADFTTAAYAANIGRALRGLVESNRGSNGFQQENA